VLEAVSPGMGAGGVLAWVGAAVVSAGGSTWAWTPIIPTTSSKAVIKQPWTRNRKSGLLEKRIHISLC